MTEVAQGSREIFGYHLLFSTVISLRVCLPLVRKSFARLPVALCWSNVWACCLAFFVLLALTTLADVDRSGALLN